MPLLNYEPCVSHMGCGDRFHSHKRQCKQCMHSTYDVTRYLLGRACRYDSQDEWRKYLPSLIRSLRLMTRNTFVTTPIWHYVCFRQIATIWKWFFAVLYVFCHQDTFVAPLLSMTMLRSGLVSRHSRKKSSAQKANICRSKFTATRSACDTHREGRTIQRDHEWWFSS